MCNELSKLLFRRQEKSLADDIIVCIEQAVDRLEPEVGHPDEVGVGEHKGDSKPPAVRLRHVPHFLRQDLAGAFTLLPGLHAD